MGTPLSTYSTHELIYAYMLASRYYSPYVYDPSGATLHEPDIWEILQNDSDIASCVQRRNQNVVRPWRVVPPPHVQSRNVDRAVSDASKRMAAICHEALGYIDRFDAARRTLAESFFVGRRYARVYYQEMWVSLDGAPAMNWFIPYHIKDIDYRRFHWVPEWETESDGIRRKTGVHLEMFDTNYAPAMGGGPQGNDGDTKSLSFTGWRPISTEERRTLIEYVWQNNEDRLGHGRGAKEALFYTHFFKTGTVKNIQQWLNRFGQGFLIGKLESLRGASSDLTVSQLTANMKTVLQTMRTENVAVLDEGDSVELLESTGANAAFALDMVRYWNESAERLSNGSVRPAGHSVDGTGSKAAGAVEADTSEAFYQFPRQDLDDVLNRDVLGQFIYFNEHNFEALGLDVAKRPKFACEQVRRQDPKSRLETLITLAGVAPVLTSELYEAADATPVGPDDEFVGGPGSSLDPAMQAEQQLMKRLAHDRPGSVKKAQEEAANRGTKRGSGDGNASGETAATEDAA